MPGKRNNRAPAKKLSENWGENLFFAPFCGHICTRFQKIVGQLLRFVDR
jgi:hypothetical protein